MGVAASLVYDLDHSYELSLPFPRRLYEVFGFDWPSGYSGEDLCKMVDDGRTPADGYTISTPCEPQGSGELKGTSIFPIMVGKINSGNFRLNKRNWIPFYFRA